MNNYQYKKGDHVVYYTKSGRLEEATVTQDRDGFTVVYIELDSDKGAYVSVPDDRVSLPKGADKSEELRRELAEAIHKVTCHYNHVDQCSWYYGSWESRPQDRASYLTDADKIIAIPGIDVQSVLKGIKALR